jgi:hypothetical protein
LLRATILTITMKTVAISFLTSLILTVSAAATPLPRWQITLTDGSRIVVDPQSHALQLASKPLGAKLAIPISAIRGVEPGGDRGVIVTFGNGDRISGHLKGPPLEASTLFGNINPLSPLSDLLNNVLRDTPQKANS